MGKIPQNKGRGEVASAPCVYGKRHFLPRKSRYNNAKEHDRGQLEIMVDDKECMYVFDRGYLDYERFDRMTDDGYFFLSRLRKNAVIREVYNFKLPKIHLFYPIKWF